jgi:hypothetical protein
MWIKTFNNDLINLDNVENIYSRKKYEWEDCIPKCVVVAVFNRENRSEILIGYNTLEECQKYIDDLFDKLNIPYESHFKVKE